jgi:hypothetical protein
MGTLQEGEQGGGPTIPLLNTYINPILPYEQTASSVPISAIADSSLDNVTLFYRWSTDNWTTSWTTLKFDDFENGFGNYSDGGDDCILYTDRVNSYQENNSVNLQDGTASSYMVLFDGLDLSTPDYIQIKIDFWAYYRGIEPGEYIEIYFDGQSVWTFYANGFEDEFIHHVVLINETEYSFDTDVKIRFETQFNNKNDDVYIDYIFINGTTAESIDWIAWPHTSNPDMNSPWSWNFNFPNTTGYYEFYSIGQYMGTAESPPINADARCKYIP